MATQKRYSTEVRERAVRLVLEQQGDLGGVSPETFESASK